MPDIYYTRDHPVMAMQVSATDRAHNLKISEWLKSEGEYGHVHPTFDPKGSVFVSITDIYGELRLAYLYEWVIKEGDVFIVCSDGWFSRHFILGKESRENHA